MPPEDLDQLIRVVVREPEAWPQLSGRRDRDSFCTAVVEAAESLGLHVTAEVVAARLQEERRSWLERWV